MIIPIIYPTALEFWTNNKYAKLLDGITDNSLKRRSLPDNYSFELDPNIVRYIMQEFDLSAPVSLMAPSAAFRRSNQLVHCLTKPKHLADDSFIQLLLLQKDSSEFNQEYYYIVAASPELCFLQASSNLSFYELVQLGYNLCADFVCDPNEQFGILRRTPFTNVEKIRNYLDRSANINGVKAAKNALPFIMDHARSPMEINLSMVVSMPPRFGGFSANGYSLNEEADLTAEAIRILGYEKICCDLIWKEKKVVLEYDSNLTHLEPEQHAKDKRRITALNISGYQVFTVTAEDMRSVQKIRQIMFALRSALGLKTDKKIFEKYSAAQQNLLDFIQDSLWNKNEIYGNIFDSYLEYNI